MGLLSTLFAPRVGAATVYPGKHPSDPSLAGLLHGAGDTSAGVLITEYTALNLSGVWAAVNAISGGLAMMPLCLYRKKGQGKVMATEHPAYRLTAYQPSPVTIPIAWQQTGQVHALTWGNGYSLIERDGAGRPIALHVIGPNRVTPDYDDDGKVFYRVRNPAGMVDTIVPAEDMIHIAGLGWDGVCGYSVVRMAAESLGLGKATERFGATFFGNGARPSGLIKAPTARKKETRQELRESFERIHQGPSNAHRVAVLWGDMDYVALGIPPEDAQFLATREFQIVEICRWFQVSPHLLHDLSRATFSNIEELGRSFVTYTLGVWMVRWEQELGRRLLREEEREDYFFEHDTTVLLRGNAQAQAAVNQIRRQNGIINADEWREMDGLNPTEDGSGKVYLVNSAMVRADVAGAEPAPEPKEQPEASGAAAAKGSYGDVQATALNGAQIASFLTIAQAVVAGEMPGDGAREMLEASFPAVPPDRIERLVAALESFEPEEPEPEEGEGAPPPKGEPPADDATARAWLADACARMVRRVCTAARRAAAEPKRYCAWLDSFPGEHQETVAEVLAPALAAAGYVHSAAGAAILLLDRLHRALAALADGCTPVQLPAAAERLTAELEAQTPAAITAELLGGLTIPQEQMAE